MITRRLFNLGAVLAALGCSGTDPMKHQLPVNTRMWGTEVQVPSQQITQQGVQTSQLVRVENSALGVQTWSVYLGFITTRPGGGQILNAEFDIQFGVGKGVSLRKMSLTYNAGAATVTDDFRNVIANYGEIYKVLEIPASTINIGCRVTEVFVAPAGDCIVTAFVAPLVAIPGSTINE